MATDSYTNDTLNGWRAEPMYSFSEAAHLAGVSSSTVRNWLRGYSVDNRQVAPLFSDQPSHAPRVSFLQLIEIVVASRFRKAVRSVPYWRVRRAYENARKLSTLEYPFAHHRLEALGGHIVSWIDEPPADRALALDEPAQRTLPGLIQETVSQLVYDHDLAARWYPVGRTVPIVVDPRVSTGMPVIDGRGVTVQAIRKRFKAGLRIDFIAKDFDMDRDLIETALQYWERVAA